MTTSNNKDVQENAQLSMLTSINKHVLFFKMHNCQLPPPTTNMFKKMHNCQPNGATTNNKHVPEISPLSMLTSNNKTCRGKSTIGVIKLKHQDFIPPQLVFFFFFFFFFLNLNENISRKYLLWKKLNIFLFFQIFFFSSQLQTAVIAKLKLRVCESESGSQQSPPHFCCFSSPLLGAKVSSLDLQLLNMNTQFLNSNLRLDYVPNKLA